MSDETPEQYDPSTQNGDEVAAHVAKLDDVAEVERIGTAEAAGKDRKGVREAVEARLKELATPADEGAALKETLGIVDAPEAGQWSAKSGASGEPAGHQDGAPADLAALVDASEEVGYLVPAEKPERPDYSQRNPLVMNGGAKADDES